MRIYLLLILLFILSCDSSDPVQKTVYLEPSAAATSDISGKAPEFETGIPAATAAEEPVVPEGIPIHFITAEKDDVLTVSYKGIVSPINDYTHYLKPGQRYKIALTSLDGIETCREYTFYEELAGETLFISHESNECIVKNIAADISDVVFDGISLENEKLVLYETEKLHVPISYVQAENFSEYIIPVHFLLKNKIFDFARFLEAIENGLLLGQGQSEGALQLHADWLATPSQSIYMNTFRYRETNYGEYNEEGPDFIDVAENQILRNLAIVNPTEDIIGAELELTVGKQVKVIPITDEVYSSRQRADSYYYGPNVEFEQPGMLEIPFQTVDLLPPFSDAALHASLKKNGQVISENSFTAPHYNRSLNRDIGIYSNADVSAFESGRPASEDANSTYYLYLKNNAEFKYLIVFEEVVDTTAYRPVLIKDIVDVPVGPAVFSFNKEAFEGDLFFLAVKDLNDTSPWTTVFAGPVIN